MNAQNDYFKRLNGVNLLLLKQHAFLLEKKQYEEEIAELDKLIKDFKENPDNHSYLTVEAEFESLHKIIKMNKKEIAQLQSKLEQRDVMTTYLTELLQARKKYEKLIDSDYQNGIQQKLSMIRGKVDDLKKKMYQNEIDQQHLMVRERYCTYAVCLFDRK